jgi:hypothetical protein
VPVGNGAKQTAIRAVMCLGGGGPADLPYPAG